MANDIEVALRLSGGSAFESGMGRAGKAAADFARSSGQSAESTSKAGGALRSFAADAASAAAGFATFAAVSSLVHNVMGEVERDFLSFDSSITNSLSIVSGATPALRKELEGVSTEVSTRLNFSASAAADALYFLNSAGKTTEQTIAEMPAVATLARAGMMGLADASDSLTQIQAALGLGSKDLTTDLAGVTRISDVLAKGSVATNATISDLADSLAAKGAAAAKTFGLSLEDVVAALGIFADQGTKGRRAGEAIDIVLRSISQSAAENGEAWSELGINVYDTQGRFAGLPSILGQMEQALAGASDQQRFLTLQQLGFTAESLPFVAQLLGQSGAIRDLAGELQNAGGATQDIADRQMASLANRLGAAKEQALAFARDALPKIVSGIRELGQELRPAFDALGNLAGSAREALEPLARALATIAGGAALGTLRALVSILATVVNTVAGSRTAITLLGAALTTNLIARGLVPAVLALTEFIAGLTAATVAEGAATVAGAGLTGGMGLLGLALTGAIAGYALWKTSNDGQATAIVGLTDALRNQTQTVRANTDAWVANASGKNGGDVDPALKDLLQVTDTGTIAKALQGDKAAYDEITAAVNAHNAALGDDGFALGLNNLKTNILSEALGRLTIAYGLSGKAAIDQLMADGKLSTQAVETASRILALSGSTYEWSDVLQKSNDIQASFNRVQGESIPIYGGVVGAMNSMGKGTSAVAAQFEGLGDSADDAQKKIDQAIKDMNKAFDQLINGPLSVLNSKIDFGDAVEAFQKLAQEPKTTKEELDKSAGGMVTALEGVVLAMQKAGKSPEEAKAAWDYGMGLILQATGLTVDQLEAELGGIDLTHIGTVIGEGYGNALANGISAAFLAAIPGVRTDITNGVISVGGVPIDVIDSSAPKSRAAGAAMVDSVSDGIAANGAKAKSVFDDHVSRPIWNGLVDDATGAGQAAGEALGAVMAGLSDYIPKTPSDLLTAMFGTTGQFGQLVNSARQFSQYVREGMSAITNSPTGARLFDASGVGAADTNAQITAYNSAVDSMAQTYADLAQATDQATADMLLSQGLAADEFDRTARAIIQAVKEQTQARATSISDQQAWEDFQHDQGVISNQQYLGVLQARLVGLRQYSQEWLAVWRQITQVQQTELDRQQQAIDGVNLKRQISLKTQQTMADNQFKLGAMDAGSYTLLLRAQQAQFAPYTDEWTQIEETIRSIWHGIAQAEVDAVQNAAQAQQDALDKAVQSQQSAAQAIADAWNAVASPILKAGSLVDAFSGQLSVSGGTIQSFMGHQVEAAHRWADALHDLQTEGLDPRILSQLAQQGPQGLGTATGLLSLGASGISGINSQYQDIAGVAGSVGSWASASGGVGGIVLNGGIQLNITGADGTVTMADVTTAIVQAFGTLQDLILVGAGR